MDKKAGELRELLEAQKQLLSKYETIVTDYETSDLVTENKKLQEEIKELKRSNQVFKDECKASKLEARAAKSAIHEMVLSEKIHFIEKSEERLEIYFKEECSSTVNQLTELEERVQEQLKATDQRIVKEMSEELEWHRERIKVLNAEVEDLIKNKKKEFRARQAKIQQNMKAEYMKLKEEPIRIDVMEKRMKANNIEVKIGLNWVNKAGIFLILIGLVTAMRYSFKYFFSDEVKGIFGLLCGIAFLLGGEYCARREKRTFSQGMIGGGIGILYITVFCSYFLLHILSMPTAFIFAILISITSFVLSIRYDSRTIGCFALIGGYLPLLAYGLVDGGITGEMAYLSMGYVLLLNIVTLFISSKKNWPVLDYLSFYTNIPVAIYLAFAVEQPIAGIIYSLLTFLMYMVIILVGLIKEHRKLSIGKVFVMGCDTVSSCVAIGILFVEAGLKDWLGLSALIFGVIYYALSKYIEKQVKKEKILPILFNITALTFAILVIPLQFDRAYFSLGWLIQSILFIGYGLRVRNEKLEFAGKIIFGLCLGTFYLDIGKVLFDAKLFDEIMYVSIVAGTIGVLAIYIYKNRKAVEKRTLDNIGLIVYKYFTICSVWIYLIRIALKVVKMNEGLSNSTLPLNVLLFSLITALMLSLIKRVKWLYDSGSPYVVIVGFIMLDVIGIFYNAVPYVMQQNDKVVSLVPIAVVVMLLWNVLVVMNLSSMLREIIVRGKYSVEIYPMTLAMVLLGNMTMILGIQFSLGLGSVIISICYVLSAFVMIGIGIRYGYRKLRYFGLGLCLFSLGKLFLFDFTMGVATGYKILSYFGFGIILLIISYLYQKFSKYVEGYTLNFSEKKEEAVASEIHDQISNISISDDDE